MKLKQIFCSKETISQLLQKPFISGSHDLWQIKTSRGLFALKLIHNNSLASSYIIQGELIAKAFANSDIAVVTAIAFDNNIIHEIAGKKFLISKWYDGSMLSAGAVASNYAFQIGNLLAKLHVTNLKLPNILTARWQIFDSVDSQFLGEMLRHTRLANNLLQRLDGWLKNYFVAKANLTKAQVISHGDLQRGNVIWDNNCFPCLIDWEAAGWIHPQIELVGVLLNWSGANIGNLSHESFANILQGYRTVGCEVAIDENVLWASLGSWFAWMHFNLRQLISAERDTKIEIIKTIKILQRFIDKFSVLLSWIKTSK